MAARGEEQGCSEGGGAAGGGAGGAGGSGAPGGVGECNLVEVNIPEGSIGCLWPADRNDRLLGRQPRDLELTLKGGGARRDKRAHHGSA